MNHSQPSIELVRLCTCFNVRLAARAITQFYNEALAPSGLLATQFSLLVALKGDSPMSIGELAGVLGLDRTTLARNLRPLETREWVGVKESEKDARVKEVWLTPQGEATLSHALPLWKQAQDSMAAYLGENPMQQIHQALWKIAQVETLLKNGEQK